MESSSSAHRVTVTVKIPEDDQEHVGQSAGREYFYIDTDENLTISSDENKTTRIKEIYKLIMQKPDGLNDNQLSKLERINIEYPSIKKLSQSDNAWFKNLRIKYQEVWNSVVSFFMNGGKTDSTLARDIRRTANSLEIEKAADQAKSGTIEDKDNFIKTLLLKDTDSPERKYAKNQFKARNKVLISTFKRDVDSESKRNEDVKTRVEEMNTSESDRAARLEKIKNKYPKNAKRPAVDYERYPEEEEVISSEKKELERESKEEGLEGNDKPTT